MVGQPHRAGGSKSRRSSVLLLCLVLFLIYLSNVRFIYTGDTVATRFLPFSLLLHGHLSVDEWMEPYVRGPLPHGPYWVTRSRGHWMSSYPIITPLAVTPLYLAPAWWLARQPAPLSAESMRSVAQGMEKISAALLAALSAGILFAALRNATSPGASLAIALVYSLGSSTWNISSQDLYSHGLTELCFALLLWLLLGPATRRGYTFWIGLTLAVAVANKPPNAVMALAVGAYFLRRERSRLLAYLLPFCVLGPVVLGYNLYFFGTPFGAYPEAFRTAGMGGITDALGGSLWAGITGLLFSPNRSILIYMPWTLFALWGAVRLWRRNSSGWARYLIAGVIVLFLFYAKAQRWWGGWCFGPRYVTDLLPFLAFFLVPVWPAMQTRRLLRAAFVVAAAAALWVQVVGVYYFPSGEWDYTPVSVDAHPARLWDWSDTQLRRTWQAGPAPSRLTLRWRQLWTRR